MKVSCVLAVHELDGVPADLVVFPEGISRLDLDAAQLSHPNAFIAAAIEENGCCRGILMHQRRNRIEYLKIGSDGRTVGSRNICQSPVYQAANVCVGMIICMDVNNPVFLRTVVDKIRSSTASQKFLCIPADMDANWFVGDKLAFPQEFGGVHVVVCNHTKTYPDIRCASFITDTLGTKIKVQRQHEPIHAELTPPDPISWPGPM